MAHNKRYRGFRPSYDDLDEIGKVMYCDTCSWQDPHEHCQIPNASRLEQWMRGIEARLQQDRVRHRGDLGFHQGGDMR